jgi:hypothetical protein
LGACGFRPSVGQGVGAPFWASCRVFSHSLLSKPPLRVRLSDSYNRLFIPLAIVLRSLKTAPLHSQREPPPVGSVDCKAQPQQSTSAFSVGTSPIHQDRQMPSLSTLRRQMIRQPRGQQPCSILSSKTPTFPLPPTLVFPFTSIRPPRTHIKTRHLCLHSSTETNIPHSTEDLCAWGMGLQVIFCQRLTSAPLALGSSARCCSAAAVH